MLKSITSIFSVENCGQCHAKNPSYQISDSRAIKRRRSLGIFFSLGENLSIKNQSIYWHEDHLLVVYRNYSYVHSSKSHRSH